MNVLKPARKLAVLSALLEGCSIRATSRMTGVHKTTIARLLVETGEQCAVLMNERLRNLPCTEIEADEIWTFVGKKQRRLTPDERSNPELGDQYTFVGFDPTSKLIAAYAVGKRNAWTTTEFLLQLRARIPGRIQLSTDGFAQYPAAVGGIYGSNIDYAQIDKRYAAAAFDESRYSPPTVTGIDIRNVIGRPERSRVCTSYVERNNLTIRMQVRRFTRLTLGFSRKLRNLKAAVALYFAHYNFCRIHGSLRMTPAMALGITDSLWNTSDLLTGGVK